jgi:hypothetical protein
MKKPDVHAIWLQVKENKRRLEGCKQHFFPQEKFKIGQKVACANCSGEMHLSEIADYIAGFVAAGGSAKEIMPAWSKPMTLET